MGKPSPGGGPIKGKVVKGKAGKAKGKNKARNVYTAQKGVMPTWSMHKGVRKGFPRNPLLLFAAAQGAVALGMNKSGMLSLRVAISQGWLGPPPPKPPPSRRRPLQPDAI